MVSRTTHQYAIEWDSPKELKGSITEIGDGQHGLDQAKRYLWLCTRLPGEQRGHVVSRTVTWSDWTDCAD